MILFTPNVGVEDAEAKIAYGLFHLLTRVVEDASKISLRPMRGYYFLDVNESRMDDFQQKIQKKFEEMCNDYLTREALVRLPGVQAKYATLYAQSFIDIGGFDLMELFKSATEDYYRDFRSPACPHIEKGAKAGGLILAISSHTGKPYGRDRIYQKSNIKLCSICMALALIGQKLMTLQIRTTFRGKEFKRAILTLVPRSSINGDDFNTLQMKMRDCMETTGRLQEVPALIIPIVVLSRYKDLAEVLTMRGIRYDLHISSLESKIGRGWTTRGTSILDISSIASFVCRVPAREDVLKAYDSLRKGGRGAEILETLTFMLISDDVSANRRHMSNFAKDFYCETGKYLYYETTEYLLTEVCHISKHIILNDSIADVARGLSYFASVRNFGYIDEIRNATTLIEFERSLASGLRELRTRYEAEEKVYLPSEGAIKEVISLAAENLEETKLSIAILALSWRPTAKLKEEVQK